MPRIFESINVDETSNYNDYEAMQEFYNSSESKPNVDIDNNITKGFLLSYGVNSGVVPVGTFVLVGYEDKNGVPIGESDALFLDAFVVFKQVEIEDDKTRIKPDGGTILIPYRNYSYAFKIVGHNNKQFGYFSGDQGVTPDSIEGISEVFGDTLAYKRPNADIKSLDLYGSRLDDINAVYTSYDGKDMGANYTIFPFELVLGMYMDSDIVKDNFIYEDSNGTLKM
ncbi:MAG: hypothetical protein IKP79_01765 [Bacilli bacterium]|nr:hypothetical protein [Bacilli bacterium]